MWFGHLTKMYDKVMAMGSGGNDKARASSKKFTSAAMHVRGLQEADWTDNRRRKTEAVRI